ncbi:HAD-IA family hydrolase [Vogesella sp. LIG4]|uniref:HAD-IA family hydrolase n=1 Tax=Vogesella sp. LIG4 TaxID=1192162 RepID=UPI00082013F0|nr:HAD-IA family hydrolase [Vogesella sp. LIG4]SCK21311.1 phosphoglycolate phosphatase [Vogesella sp. LIG4]
MKHELDLVVFDWDGTLMDSTAHIVHSIQAACHDLGLPTPPRERASHVIGLGLVDAMRHVCPGLPESRYQDMVMAYRHHYLSGDETIELFEGVAEGLAALEDAGYLLAVATGKSRVGLDRVLAATGLGKHFLTTRTADECQSKPHPEMLLQITDQLGMLPARTLMVGDTTHDLLMARNAGTMAVGMSYGAHPLEDLEDCEPRAIFHSFAELQAWLLSGN